MKLRAIARPVVTRIPPTDPGLIKAWTGVYKRAASILEKRLAENGILEIEYAPGGDMVIIYRLPERRAEVTTKSGILIASPSQVQELTGKLTEAPYNVGLLISAGPEAADVLEAKGFFPGDYVVFSRFAGDEETVGRVNEAISTAAAQGLSKEAAMAKASDVRDRMLERRMLLRMRAHEIQASSDLKDRLYSDKPELEMVRQVSNDGVLHLYRPTGVK